MANVFVKVDSSGGVVVRNTLPEGSATFVEANAAQTKNIRGAVTRFANRADDSTSAGRQFKRYPEFLKHGRLKLKNGSELAAKIKSILNPAEDMLVAAKGKGV